MATPWDGAMRVLRDVVIQRTEQRTENDELHAVSHVPAVVGEEMTLDLIGAGGTLALRVRVADSRPMMVDGSVRHRIGLAVVKGDDKAPVATIEHRAGGASDTGVAEVPVGIERLVAAEAGAGAAVEAG